MIYIRVLAVVALIGSVIWLTAEPGFEPALAVVVSSSALVSAFLVHRRSKPRAQQYQSVSGSSLGLQAGGDVSIGDAGSDKHAQ